MMISVSMSIIESDIDVRMVKPNIISVRLIITPGENVNFDQHDSVLTVENM